MDAIPEKRGTVWPKGWPSLVKVTEPVGGGMLGCGMPGATVAVKLYAPAEDTSLAERVSEVPLATCVEPVTTTAADGETESR
jgi:hypothetical protein